MVKFLSLIVVLGSIVASDAFAAVSCSGEASYQDWNGKTRASSRSGSLATYNPGYSSDAFLGIVGKNIIQPCNDKVAAASAGDVNSPAIAKKACDAGAAAGSAVRVYAWMGENTPDNLFNQYSGDGSVRKLGTIKRTPITCQAGFSLVANECVKSVGVISCPVGFIPAPGGGQCIKTAPATCPSGQFISGGNCIVKSPVVPATCGF